MQKFTHMIQQLRTTRGLNDKKLLLGGYNDPEIKEILLYALNPYMMFNVTSKKLKDVKSGTEDLPWLQAKLILDRLHKREVTGNAAVDLVKAFLLEAKPDQQKAFLSILDKDLDVGAGATLVNAVWEKLIPQFEVQLCKAYDELDKLPFTNTYVARKLDGIRVVAIKRDSSGFRFFSREGNEFTTLSKLKAALDNYFLNHPEIVLDGEVCVVDEAGNEDFTAAVSQIKRKDYTMENPKYILFDMLELEEFDNCEGKTPFEKRYNDMRAWINPDKYFNVLKQIKVSTPEEVQNLMANAEDLGWEGLIIRNGDAVYEGKRTKNLLKVKKFEDQEFEIIDTLEGTGQFTGMLGALVVKGKITNEKDKEFFGVEVISEVGSGFKQKGATDTDGERYKLWQMREQLKGQIATIQYFEVSKDKTGQHSLRFPVFKVLHGAERTM